MGGSDDMGDRVGLWRILWIGEHFSGGRRAGYHACNSMDATWGLKDQENAIVYEKVINQRYKTATTNAQDVSCFATLRFRPSSLPHKITKDAHLRSCLGTLSSLANRMLSAAKEPKLAKFSPRQECLLER